MWKKDALKVYYNTGRYKGKIGTNLLHSYKDADRLCVINNHDDEVDLKPIETSLPEPPDWHLIDGWGQEPSEQVFHKQVYPPRLKALERKFGTIEDIWAELNRKQRFYAEEIGFIKKQWYHLLNGYWCFIEGKPTYIDGDHYVYLNDWHLMNTDEVE